MMTNFALTIAASDTSGGAGVQRDIKTFYDIGVEGLSVITGITAQTNKKVYFIAPLPVEQIEKQLTVLYKHYNINAVKIGVVFTAEIMKSIKKILLRENQKNIVVDPIIKASDGLHFLDNADLEYFKKEFLPIAYIITPNIPELEELSQYKIDSKTDIVARAKKLSNIYNSYLFVKGGHIKTSDNKIHDYLVRDSYVKKFSHPKIHLSQSHGTGCLISSAITAYLAKGYAIDIAIQEAKKYFYSIE